MCQYGWIEPDAQNRIPLACRCFITMVRRHSDKHGRVSTRDECVERVGEVW
jgi:hypothetical protein